MTAGRAAPTATSSATPTATSSPSAARSTPPRRPPRGSRRGSSRATRARCRSSTCTWRAWARTAPAACSRATTAPSRRATASSRAGWSAACATPTSDSTSSSPAGDSPPGNARAGRPGLTGRPALSVFSESSVAVALVVVRLVQRVRRGRHVEAVLLVRRRGEVGEVDVGAVRVDDLRLAEHHGERLRAGHLGDHAGQLPVLLQHLGELLRLHAVLLGRLDHVVGELALADPHVLLLGDRVEEQLRAERLLTRLGHLGAVGVVLETVLL